MKRTQHGHLRVVGKRVQGGVLYKLQGQHWEVHLEKKDQMCKGVDHNTLIWRWHKIPMFSLILGGRMREVCGCIAFSEGMWSGHIWWGCLFQAQMLIECQNRCMGCGRRWVIRVLETSAKRFGDIYGEVQRSLFMGICSCGCAIWCMLRSFWVYKLIGQPSHVSAQIWGQYIGVGS